MRDAKYSVWLRNKTEICKAGVAVWDCYRVENVWSAAVDIHRAEIVILQSCDSRVVTVDKQIHKRFEESSLFDVA